MLYVLGTRDRNNVFSLSKHPGNRQLRRATSFLRSQHFYLLYQLQVFIEILSLKPRHVYAVVFNIFRPFIVTAKKPPAKRSIGNKSDAQFPDCRKDFGFNVTSPKRILDLKGSDRMNGCSSADACGRSFREADKTNNTFFYQF